MRAQKIFEKFDENSDPIDDMGIGVQSIIKNWEQRIFELDEKIYLEEGILTQDPFSKNLIFKVPRIIIKAELDENFLNIRVYNSIEINKKGKKVISFNHIKKVLLRSNLWNFLIFKGRKRHSIHEIKNTYVFEIKPAYVNYFKKYE